MGLDRPLRRLIPSVARITYNPVFRGTVGAADFFPGRLYREFRKLPPNYLRCRVGVGNRLFANQVHFLTVGEPFWLSSLAEGYLQLDGTVIELGCGPGRFAHHLRDLDYYGTRFTGRYLGVDIDEDAVAWCRANFDPERFTFHLSPHTSATYMPGRQATAERSRLPVDDSTVDFVYAHSLVTHLLEPELRNYLEEAARVLKPGRRAVLSCFCLDLEGVKRLDRHTFRHRMGDAWVESKRVPEAAVAYRRAFLEGAAREAGFSAFELRRDPKESQQLLILTR